MTHVASLNGFYRIYLHRKRIHKPMPEDTLDHAKVTQLQDIIAHATNREMYTRNLIVLVRSIRSYLLQPVGKEPAAILHYTRSYGPPKSTALDGAFLVPADQYHTWHRQPKTPCPVYLVFGVDYYHHAITTVDAAGKMHTLSYPTKKECDAWNRTWRKMQRKRAQHKLRRQKKPTPLTKLSLRNSLTAVLSVLEHRFPEQMNGSLDHLLELDRQELKEAQRTLELHYLTAMCSQQPVNGTLAEFTSGEDDS